MDKVNVNGGRHRPRPPARLLRRQADGHAAQRARAHPGPLRPPDHVRGRRHGQRHHHRAPGLTGPDRPVAADGGRPEWRAGHGPAPSVGRRAPPTRPPAPPSGSGWPGEAGEDGADGGNQPEVVHTAGEQAGVVEDDDQHARARNRADDQDAHATRAGLDVLRARRGVPAGSRPGAASVVRPPDDRPFFWALPGPWTWPWLPWAKDSQSPARVDGRGRGTPGPTAGTLEGPWYADAGHRQLRLVRLQPRAIAGSTGRRPGGPPQRRHRHRRSGRPPPTGC